MAWLFPFPTNQDGYELDRLDCANDIDNALDYYKFQPITEETIAAIPEGVKRVLLYHPGQDKDASCMSCLVSELHHYIGNGPWQVRLLGRIDYPQENG